VCENQVALIRPKKTAGRAPHSETPGPQVLNLLRLEASSGLNADADWIRLIKRSRTIPLPALLPRLLGVRKSFNEPGHGLLAMNLEWSPL
jgi:hypothetical protein